MHKNIIQLPDPETPLYRVFTSDRLEEVFTRQRLALVQPQLWDDPFENFLLKAKLRNSRGELCGFSMHQQVYGQCWTLQNESDAMWRIYASKKDGVIAKTTVGRLWDAFYSATPNLPDLHCWLGRIEYCSQSDLSKMASRCLDIVTDTSGFGIAAGLFFKRQAFDHEREVRLLFTGGKNPSQTIHFVPIQPDHLFEELTFDPRVTPAAASVEESRFRKLGFTGRCTRSTLYDAPEFVIDCEF